MRKTNTEHLTCIARLRPSHTASHTHTCWGRAVPSATRAPAAGAQDKLSSKGKGRTRVLDSFFFLSSAKPQRCEDRNKERNESWIPDPFKSSLITRDPNAKHFQDEKCCQIMFTIQICQTRKTSWIQVISVHSYSLNSELPRAPFQYTRLLVYTWPSRQRWYRQRAQRKNLWGMFHQCRQTGKHSAFQYQISW